MKTRISLALICALNLAFLLAPSLRVSAAQFAEVDPGLAQPPFPCVVVGDYDGDGDPDVLVAGNGKKDVPFAIIYKNNGGVFTDSGILLTGLSRASAAWGDFDGDGDLDLAMTGLNISGVPTMRIYRNDGGVFTALPGTFSSVFAGNLAWGDYDGDGDLDLLVTGINSPSAGALAFTTLYRNDSNGVFTSVPHPFPNCYLGAASWGDYDDGHLDLVLAGATSGGGLVSGLWHNDSHGNFTNSGVALPAMDLGYAVWGDYDGDGDLDLLFGGNTDAGFISRVYRNDNGTFTDINAGLLPVLWASAAWGDYDNDGDLDAMIIGYDPVAQTSRSILYRNDGGGVFTDSGATFHNLFLGTVNWFDYDNDGRLDLIMAGNETGLGDLLRLAHNTVVASNNVPVAPANLTVTFNGTTADFAWNVASDLQTPAAALTYNIRVGTNAGGSQIVTAQSSSTGYRRLTDMGNAQLARVGHLRGLQPGVTYYWSVQTVDSAFAGSAFAVEQSFTMPPAAPRNISFHRDNLGTVHGLWLGTPGTTYRIEVSSNLKDWNTLTSLTASNLTGLFELSETPPAGANARFYRSAFP